MKYLLLLLLLASTAHAAPLIQASDIAGGVGVFVSSVNSPVATSTVDFTYAYISSETYCVYYSLAKDASVGVANITVNGASANYQSGAIGYRAVSGWDASATSTSFCRFTIGGNTMDASQPYSGYFCFVSEPSGGRVQLWGSMTGLDAGSISMGSSQNCEYTNGLPTKITINAGSGNFSQIYAKMYRLPR